MAGGRARKKVGPPPSVVFGEQVRGVRLRRGLASQQRLVDRLGELGYAVDRSTINRLENGSRGVSLDEAFAVAAALGVSPLSLMLPLEMGQPVAVAPGLTVTSAEARAWAKGDEPLPGQDPQFFEHERPVEWVDVLVQRRIQALDALVAALADAWSAEDTEQVADALDALDEEIQRQRSEAKRLAKRQGKGH